ncbi:hypothetical protein SALINJAH_3 [Bacillus phage SalinJah]|uniref:Uncharacterized protein n=1 Tax=Bacillus phage SalinJah TaxID=1837830 RepID=A0A173GBF7_9CAUD|nr:hypothetical protein [Bacillus thuringiensis]YP_009281957.1 hypothetical protein SALINJAH_3 [Bacillus phage SalinJah]ANH50652.1 hypothetical protein SALINJAH_3 [Bacillus phage SalinJah]OTZ47945.1 hypothetical protein BK762_19880 [Bacillus thuringiensis serovar toumanoffi]
MITIIKLILLFVMIVGLPVSIALLANNVEVKDGWEVMVGMVFAVFITMVELILLCIFIIL